MELCTIERRDALLSKPVLRSNDISELMGISQSFAYRWIERIRYYASQQNKPLPLGKSVTTASYKDYFDIK